MADEIAGSSPAEPVSESPPVEESTAPATEAPPEPTPDAAASPVTEDQGPIPFSRHKEILENTRSKAREEAVSQYTWASQAAPEEWQAARQWYQQAQTDPVRHVSTVLEEMRQHPMLRLAIQEIVKPYVAQPETVPEDIKPEIPVVDAQGNVTGYAYSDKQVRQLLDQKLKPLQETQQHAQQRQQQEQMVQERRRQADAWAVQKLTTLRKHPEFVQHEADVSQTMMANPSWSVDEAWAHVLATKVVPSVKQSTVAQLQAKARSGSVGTDAGSATRTPKFGPNDWEKAMEYYAAHPEEAERMASR